MAKVTARLIFKLPFPLKMKEAHDCSPQVLRETQSEEIVIYPPIYAPHLAHKKLYELNIQKPEEIELDKLNSIVIDIRRDFPTIPITEEEQKDLVAKTREILYDLLTLCKCRGRQLHISVIDVEHFDYRLRLFDSAGHMMHSTGMSHLTLPTLPFKGNDWNSMCQNLINGNKPELYEILLLDAHSLAYHDPPHAILNAATARDVYIKRFYKSRDRRKAALKSIEQNRPELLQELDYLRRSNNFVKHNGKCQYIEGGKVIEVDSTRAWQLINAVEEAIEYTKSLRC